MNSKALCSKHYGTVGNCHNLAIFDQCIALISPIKSTTLAFKYSARNSRTSQQTRGDTEMTKDNVLLPLILASLVFTAINTAIAGPANELAEMQSDDTQRETIGLIGGAILGGLIAGPPGAIALASFGLLGTTLSNEQDQKEALTLHLNQAQRDLIAMQNQQGELEARYQSAMRELETISLQRVSLNQQINDLENTINCCGDTALSLHFQTNSVQIEQHYMQSLASLAELSRELDNPQILITGYADPRGSSTDNQRLSEQRVDSVVRTLLSYGIKAEQISTGAFGENQHLSELDNPETYFFDRRVNIELQSANGELVTLSE
jgi:sortase system peptidoglycan-associated protein